MTARSYSDLLPGKPRNVNAERVLFAPTHDAGSWFEAGSARVAAQRPQAGLPPPLGVKEIPSGLRFTPREVESFLEFSLLERLGEFQGFGA